MRIITVMILIFGFLLLRPYQLQKDGLNYVGDDSSYFAYASSIAFFEYPSYEKEFFCDRVNERPLHFPGAGFMAAPFVCFFSLIDRMQGSPIVIKRTLENIIPSWSLFGFVVSTLSYFWFSCFFLYKGLRLYFNEKITVLAVVLMILCQGIPLYVFRRPVYAHIYELFLQSLLVYLLITKNYRYVTKWKEILYSIFVGFLVVMIFLVRPTNIFAALWWPIVLFGLNDRKFAIRENWGKILVCYAVFTTVILSLRIIPDSFSIYAPHPYIKDAGGLIVLRSFSFYFSRLLYVLFGVDWGLVYTFPFLLIGFIFLMVCKDKIYEQLRILCLPVVVNFILIIQYGSHASWYGYRYFVFSILPIVVFSLAGFLKWFGVKVSFKCELFVCLLLSIVPIFSMLAFEGNSTNLTLSTGYSSYKQAGWHNLTYQLEVWKTLIFHPAQFMLAIFKGGPLYVIYVIANIFSLEASLPKIILEKYPFFNVVVLIKIGIIFMIPILLYFVFCKTKRFQECYCSDQK